MSNSEWAPPPAQFAERVVSSVFDQLGVQPENGKAIDLAKALLGELLDAFSPTVIKPQFGVAILNVGQLAGPEQLSNSVRIPGR